ncbi:MAG: DUF4258 domain-containing protein [Anaerolineae bacterium]|nr:DUF4258 domain-containing protein [Anaerolineae bacterium]
MLVRLTRHAEKQIVVRRLDRDQVIAVALNPEQIVEAVGEHPVAQSQIEYAGQKALLRVVFHDNVDVRLIITAYPTTQIDKYWQKD